MVTSFSNKKSIAMTKVQTAVNEIKINFKWVRKDQF